MKQATYRDFTFPPFYSSPPFFTYAPPSCTIFFFSDLMHTFTHFGPPPLQSPAGAQHAQETDGHVAKRTRDQSALPARMSALIRAGQRSTETCACCVQLILDFTRHFKLYQLDVDEAASSPLFVNSAINRACELSQSLSLSLWWRHSCSSYACGHVRRDVGRAGRLAPEHIRSILDDLAKQGTHTHARTHNSACTQESDLWDDVGQAMASGWTRRGDDSRSCGEVPRSGARSSTNG
jgi:hypothetical protein